MKSSHSTVQSVEECITLLNRMSVHLHTLLHHVTQQQHVVLYLIDWQWKCCIRPLLVSYRITCKLLLQHIQQKHNDKNVDMKPVNTQYTVLQYTTLQSLYKLLNNDTLFSAAVTAASITNTQKQQTAVKQLQYYTLLDICLPLIDDTYKQCHLTQYIQCIQLHQLSYTIVFHMFQQCITVLLHQENELTTVWLRILKCMHHTCILIQSIDTDSVQSLYTYIRDGVVECCRLLGEYKCFDVSNPTGIQLYELTYQACELHFPTIKQQIQNEITSVQINGTHVNKHHPVR